MLSARQGKRPVVACPLCSAKHLPQKGSLSSGIYAFNCENCGHFFKFKAVADVKSTITFSINGKEYTVGNEYDPATSLLEFMRRTGVSTGTKQCCKEGGCGVCLVTVTLLEPISGVKTPYTVNSCCLQLYTCDGLEVTTVEGLGNTRKGLHAIQDRLAKYDGAQCGFCSPGQVMNMNGILLKNPKPTMQEIEDEFDATICRCTGYRSILDAMKSFAVDAPASLPGGLIDIEELEGKMCRKSGKPCTGHCSKTNERKDKACGNQTDQSIHIVSNGSQWLKPTSLQELCGLLDKHRTDNYRLVFGNTGFGVYKEIGPWMYSILIDLRGVKDMYTIDFDPTIVLGGNLSISNLIDLFQRSQTDPSISYGAAFAKHLKKVSMHGIRNMAAWPGNLMLKHLHNEFVSDIFMLLETVGARLIIFDGDGTRSEVSLPDFLSLDMKGKVIAAMALPTFQSKNMVFQTFRTSLRLQACHSYVTAGFKFELDASQNYLVQSKPSIVILGINAKLIHASVTEAYLEGKQLGDPAVLKTALLTLSSELVPDVSPLGGGTAYRKSLALSMFYKFVLGACKTKVSPRYTSGGSSLERSLIVGKQDFDSDPTEFPVSKPMMKLTADYLTTGEVKFLDDLPSAPGQLSAAVVISQVAKAKIDKIDPSAALKLPGVVDFISASDIPKGGVNNWRPTGIYGDATEELLCSGNVVYNGQPIGIIVADTETTAQTGASMVQVTYKDIQEPIVDIMDGIQKKSFFPNPPPPVVVGDAKGAIAKAPLKVSGGIACGDQYHFHMESQASFCTPSDLGGMNVVATSQWIDGVLGTVAQVLGLPESTVTVENQRLGGGFGGKISQNFLVSGLAALASYVTQRPVKLHLDIHTNMKMLGKRTPYYAEYEVGFTSTGRLQGIVQKLYADVGHDTIEGNGADASVWIDNAYYCPNWLWTPIAVKTDKPMNTACRSPGSVPAIFIMESIMEHVAKALNKDPLDVRKENLYVKGQHSPSGMVLEYCTIRAVVAQLETDIKLAERKQQVEAFNKANRWKKRGLSVMPNRFAISWSGAMYNTSVIIYHGDGSVAIAHGGIDMGQGINTKVTQVCAYKLGIPMDKIRVKTSSTTINGNSITTGGSITSELACKSVIECCAILKARMAPVKAKMVDPSWEKLVAQCYADMIDLTASYMTHPKDPYPAHYSCYSASCVEAEVDILTGQYQLRQMDMLYDCGQSMNPELDIGQAEGGFVFGMGYFLQEQMVYDPKTGEALNAGTWDYKPPLAKDLPMNFNFKFQKNAPNPLGVLRSKAVGEPPVTMAAASLFAIKHAVEAARAEISKDTFFPLNAPATVEKVQSLCLNQTDQYTYGN
ncbi:xanthine dehydrogenase 1 isoform X2 [Aplysia californica]|uniref:Xanthine dehydrogenase 1 isoform X2 n=1 Tax=Aplysia californica TaxID=6500 RepID=A0ABM0K1J9_APLCA|nr:xanthine dehydrogenase 1 isoform X2 [Aplysia californica]